MQFTLSYDRVTARKEMLGAGSHLGQPLLGKWEGMTVPKGAFS